MKSKGLIVAGLSLLLAAFLALGAATRLAQASGDLQSEANIVRGAMLYDNWFAALGVDAPAGNMPIWARQTTNTRSGEDTWRCVSCHGWDYLGKDGAYHTGSGNYTGFPGLFSAEGGKSVDELVAILKGSLDPEHDFSSYLDDASLNDLAGFLNSALIDDSLYIDAQTLSVKDGDAAQGEDALRRPVRALPRRRRRHAQIPFRRPRCHPGHPGRGRPVALPAQDALWHPRHRNGHRL